MSARALRLVRSHAADVVAAVFGLALAVVVTACSSDEPQATACPATASIGSQIACECGSAGLVGVTTCLDNGTLSDCNCSPADAGGMSGSGGSGGMSSTGSGGSGGSGATGGSGGTMDAGGDGDGDGDGDAGPDAGDGDGDGDAGPDAGDGDGDGDAGPDAGDETDAGGDGDGDGDGDQNAPCDVPTDCKDGLGCFNPGTEGGGLCSIECENSDECTALPGADWTCSTSTGVCQVECDGQDDDESCPVGLVCVQTVSFMGVSAYRCKHPDEDPLPGDKGPFESCTDSDQCEGDLFCHVPGGNDTGYCTRACQNMNDDEACADLGGGEIEPHCDMPSPPNGTIYCVLDCEEDPDACPGEMHCIDYPMFSRCGY